MSDKINEEQLTHDEMVQLLHRQFMFLAKCSTTADENSLPELTHAMVDIYTALVLQT